MVGVSVRFAASSDLDFVSQDGYIPQKVVALKIDLEEVVVAEVDRQLVGYLRLEYLWSLAPYIALIWVMPERRMQGVGRAMLAFIGDLLRGNGHEALFSSCQANEPAPQAWHRYMGFEECGIIAGINEGGIGEVFFRKRLN